MKLKLRTLDVDILSHKINSDCGLDLRFKVSPVELKQNGAFANSGISKENWLDWFLFKSLEEFRIIFEGASLHFNY